MYQSEQIGELAKALSKFQGIVNCVQNGSENPYFSSKYAKLHEIRNAIREPLAECNLAVSHMPSYIDGKDMLDTILMHSSGQWLRSVMHIRTSKGDAQALGGGITYTKRQALSAILGLATYDDDGEEDRKEYERIQAANKKKTMDFLYPKKEEEKSDTDQLQERINKTGFYALGKDISLFLDFLVEKYPKKSREDLIASALSSDEKTNAFIQSLKDWQNRPV